MSNSIEIYPDKTCIYDVIEEKASSKTNEDSFFVCNLEDIVMKINQWRNLLPRVQPYYAMKANDSEVIMRLLASHGVHFECASKGEVQRVIQFGINAERIIYGHPCKQRSHLSFAAKMGVKLMAFDTVDELNKIKELYPEARLLMRIYVDDSRCVYRFGEKFGCHDFGNLFRVARDLELDIVGVSFHVGHGCFDATAFYDAIGSARVAFDKGKDQGFQMKILNIGGGFPGSRRFQMTFEEVVEQIHKGLDTFFQDDADLEVLAEPGQFFVKSSCALIVNIINKRNEAGKPCKYFVNNGLFGMFNPMGHWADTVKSPAIPLNQRSGELRNSIIYGQTCVGADCIYESCMMPIMHAGDWIVFEDMGSYSFSCETQMNGFNNVRGFFYVNEANASSVVNLKISSCPENGSNLKKTLIKNLRNSINED